MKRPWHRCFLWLPILLVALRASDAQQCRLCENGTYCFLETLFVCPLNSRSLPGSGNITDCVCIAGFYAREDHICRPCEPGSFCPGDESLQLCPSSSLSDVFATSAADCFCVPGFSGLSSACTACLPGSAKHGNGSAACVQCVAGKFQDQTAGSECKRCPAHTSTPGITGSISASACVSNPGYFNNNGVITACAPGAFQPLADQAACVDCRRGNVENLFYTVNNASAAEELCLVCPDYSEVQGVGSGHGILSCQCSAGFQGADGGPCAACAAGFAKAGLGSVACHECAADEYANPDNTLCVACTGNSTSPAASDNRGACVCAAGFALNPVAPFDCQECAAGQRAVVSGGLPVCEACPAGEYNNLRRQTACTPCPADEYQPATGQVACLACPSDSVSLQGAVLRSECACLPGFARDIDDCRQCLPGSYKDATDNTACLPCAAGQTSAVASSSAAQCQDCAPQFLASSEQGLVCQACPSNAVAPLGSVGLSTCECAPGYTGLSDACQPCASGTHKALPGSHLCTRCELGYAGVNTSVTVLTSAASCVACAENTYEDVFVCRTCPNFAVSVAGSDSVYLCTCVAGYEPGPGGVGVGGCVPCTAGLFKPAAGNVACTLCANNTYSTELAATNASTCQACPANTAQLGQLREDITTCVCRAGYEANHAGVACAACADSSFQASAASVMCTPCAANTYQPFSESVHNADTCVQCPLNSTSNSGSSTEAACTCDATFHRNGSLCQLCRPNFYCPDQDTQTECPVLMTAPGGSVALAACTCVPGYIQVNGACQMCAVNTYCLDGVVQSACPGNSTTNGQLGRANRSACVCDSGFYEANGFEGNCTLCGEDTFCANDQQITCPQNSSAPAGTGSEAECLCDDLFRRVGRVCERCLGSEICTSGGGAVSSCADGAFNQNQLCICTAGSYCSEIGAASCLDSHACPTCVAGSFCANNLRVTCPTGSDSEAASTSAADCVCVAGYYRSEVGVCTVCPIGSYCSNEQQSTCSSHDPQLTTSATGAASVAECVCTAGAFRLGLTDLCKPCPRHFFCPAASAAALPNVEACAAGAFTFAPGMALASDCQVCAPDRVYDKEEPGECVCRLGSDATGYNTCEVCLSPLMKANDSSALCAVCATDFEWRNATSCTACPRHANAAAGGVCVCGAPRVRLGDICETCGDDHYLEASSALCVRCPADSGTREGPNVNIMPAIDSCLCDAGFVRNAHGNTSSFCVPCPAGSYERQGVCELCAAGAVSQAASVNSSACLCDTVSCKAGVWLSHVCSGECELAPEPCEQCLPGSSKAAVSSLGNSERCDVCVLHSFQAESGASACQLCHGSRHTLESGAVSADECQCIAGFEDMPGQEACELCVAGYFKAERGDYDCSACAVGFFSEHDGASTCLACTQYASIRHANTTAHMASETVDNCTCDKGFFEGATGCEPCVLGSFKDHVGLGVCLFCGTTVRNSSELHNTYGVGSPAASSHAHCQACPVFSGQDHAIVGAQAPMQSKDDCFCFPGYDSYQASTGCTVCGAYEVKTGFNANVCAFCDAGHVYTSGYQPCVPCALTQVASSRVHRLMAINSVNVSYAWAASQQDCACDLGHVRVDEQCHECAAGSFRNAHATATCALCPLHYYANATATIDCHQCPSHSFTSSVGSTALGQCVCEAGYEWDSNTLQCSPCPPGSSNAVAGGTCAVCESGTYVIDVAQTSCTACAAHEMSILPRDAETTCVCAAGSGGPALCSPCAHAFYSPEGSAALRRPDCLACPAFKNTTQTGSSLQNQCLCVPGHGDAANNADPAAACAPCDTGQFSPGGMNIPCARCGFGAITEPALGATVFEQCLCDAKRGLHGAV